MLGPWVLPDMSQVFTPAPGPPARFGPRTPPPNRMSLWEVSNRLPFLSAGAKAFVCDQCGAQFSKEDALETHRQTHTGESASFPILQLLQCGNTWMGGISAAPLQQGDIQSSPGDCEWGWLGRCDFAPQEHCPGLGLNLCL